LKTTPTALNCLRRLPPQLGHTVSESSLKDWTMSKAWPQSAQA
jgi:hypothetical protein